MKTDRVVQHDTETFVELCVPLTGFAAYDLHGTGMAELYLDTARRQVGAERFTEFLGAWQAAVDRGEGPDRLPPVHHEVARAVTYLWYTGAWPRLAPAAHAALRRQVANTESTASAVSYPEGLVWRTFGGHPAGAKPPGHATWAMKPHPVPTEAEIRAALSAAGHTSIGTPTAKRAAGKRAAVPGRPASGAKPGTAARPGPATAAGPGSPIAPHLLPGRRPAPSVSPSEVPRAAEPSEQKQVSDR